jgi:hypothetical protein
VEQPGAQNLTEGSKRRPVPLHNAPYQRQSKTGTAQKQGLEERQRNRTFDVQVLKGDEWSVLLEEPLHIHKVSAPAIGIKITSIIMICQAFSDVLGS